MCSHCRSHSLDEARLYQENILHRDAWLWHHHLAFGGFAARRVGKTKVRPLEKHCDFMLRG
jgi:hypothetical protein